jgi:two-component system sensor histidine kinase/response regulator
MGIYKILIIDDEQTICDACSQVFIKEGYDVSTCFDGESGLHKCFDCNPDVVFVDLKMPGIGGLEILNKIRKRDKNIVQVVITGYATVESAVESMKKGAFDFLPKPFTPEESLIITKRALERRRVLLEAERLKEEKETMRRHFNFMVSHELRTPLVAVIQYLEVLDQEITGKISEEQKKIVNRMKIRIKELLSLIDRWLKLSMIEDVNMEKQFTSFDLTPVIKDAIELVEPLAQENGITIETKDMPSNCVIIGDKELIKEVFINLINNAIKYNRAGGSVTIRSKQDGNYWVTDIIDTGIGISENEILNITEEFYRVRKKGSKSGAGLGLAVVKKILDIHNGKLGMISKLNEGSTFSVYLPLINKYSVKGV